MTGAKGTILRVLISVTAIAVIVYSMRGEIAEAIHIMQTGVSWTWVFLGFGAYALAIAFLSIRLMLVFKSQAIHLSYGTTLYLSLLGQFFNLFLPSAIGGDLAKGYYAYKHCGKKIESMSAVLQDRLMGFITIILFALTALFFFGKEMDNPNVNAVVYLFVGIMMFAVIFLFSKRVAKVFKFLTVLIPSENLKIRLREVYDAIYNFKNHKAIFAQTLLWSLVAQVLFISSYYVLTPSVGVEMNFWMFFLIVPLVAIISMVPSIGGLGVREAGLIFFLKAYMPNEKALVISILLDMIVYGFSLCCGLLYAVKGGLRPRLVEKGIEDLEEKFHGHYDEAK